jgi:dolichyl-diphosphooligosaccharide--protein glycosyltransferase
MIPVIAVFILLLINEFIRHGISAKNMRLITIVITTVVIIGLVSLAYTGYLEGMAGKFTSVINPSARATTPLVASVAEHRVTAWGNLYTELGVGAIFFLAGLYFVLKNPTNRNIFLLLFGITGLYFGASMIRLLVIFAPAFGLLMAMGIIGLLKPFMAMLRETPNATAKAKRKLLRVSKEYSGLGILLIFILLMTQFAYAPQNIRTNDGIPRAFSVGYAPTSISSAALPVTPSEPLSQWLNMLDFTSNNLKPTDVVVAWWDYGYWLSVLGNVTTLADNATINATQIENLGFVYMANEELSLKMLSAYGQENVKYILVFMDLIVMPDDSGYYISQPWSFGDQGKWVGMADISGGARDRLIEDGFMDPNNAWSNRTAFGSYNDSGQWAWSDLGKSSVIYKLLVDVEQQFAASTGGIVIPSNNQEVTLDYLTLYKLVGIDDVSVGQYGTLVPLIGLYEVNWAAYNAAHS